MTEYVTQYQPNPELVSRAMVAWAKPQRGRSEHVKRIALGAALYVLLVGGVVLLLRYDVVTPSMLLGGVAGLGVGVLLWAVIHQQNMKKLTGFTHDAMARHGVTEARFSANNLHITSQISETRMDWRCFDEITALVDATVLRAGGVVYAVPDAALPDGVTPDQFRSDLQNWMEAAR